MTLTPRGSVGAGGLLGGKSPGGAWVLALTGLLVGTPVAGDALYKHAPGPLEFATSEAVALLDPVQEREVKLRLVYPNASGSHPLVVYSHGAFCSPDMYDRVTAHWASHGYVVALPHHLDSGANPGQMEADQLSRMLSTRIRDLSFILDSLDSLESAVDLPGGIDPTRIAVAGHSFGAMIAMVKVGLDLRVGEYTLPGSAADERFAAAVVMSGVGPMPQMTDDAFAGLTSPLFASGGTLDVGNVGTGEVFPWEWRMSAYGLAPPGDKYSLVLEEGDHYLGGLICRDDRGGAPDPEGVGIVRSLSTAFLDAYLRQDERARHYLRETNVVAATDGRARFARK